MIKVFIALAKARAPKEFLSIKDPSFSRFKDYIRSESELKSELQKLGYTKMSLEGIIELYAKYNKALADSIIPEISVDELWEIREYDRDKFTSIHGEQWNGKKTKKEYEEHVAHIKKNGINKDDYGVVQLRRKGDKILALLGEGNHRVSILRKLGRNNKLPVMFFYSEM